MTAPLAVQTAVHTGIVIAKNPVTIRFEKVSACLTRSHLGLDRLPPSCVTALKGFGWILQSIVIMAMSGTFSVWHLELAISSHHR